MFQIDGRDILRAVEQINADIADVEKALKSLGHDPSRDDLNTRRGETWYGAAKKDERRSVKLLLAEWDTLTDKRKDFLNAPATYASDKVPVILEPYGQRPVAQTGEVSD